MIDRVESRAERFLKLYRMLEGALERRMSGRRQGVSVVVDYLRDADSAPVRHDLDVCREIRNLLSHNADDAGEPPVEPSESIVECLECILNHVSHPRYAVDCGTPQEKLLCAHPNDPVDEVMHRMDKMGYSHVPILEKERLIGVFSTGSLFAYLEQNGLASLDKGARLAQLRDVTGVDRRGAEHYCFMPQDATVLQARAAFDDRPRPNCRLSAVFITKTGDKDEPLLAMLTPWDVLKDSGNADWGAD